MSDGAWALVNVVVMVLSIAGMAVACWHSTRYTREDKSSREDR